MAHYRRQTATENHEIRFLALRTACAAAISHSHNRFQSRSNAICFIVGNKQIYYYWFGDEWRNLKLNVNYISAFSQFSFPVHTRAGSKIIILKLDILGRYGGRNGRIGFTNGER